MSMTPYSIPLTLHCALVILTPMGFCLENPFDATHCAHGMAACPKNELETVEHDAVHLLQKAATKIQGQSNGLQGTSNGHWLENFDQRHFAHRIEVHQDASAHRVWTKLSSVHAGKAQIHSERRSSLVASVLHVVDMMQMIVTWPDKIALSCVVLVLIFIAVRNFICLRDVESVELKSEEVGKESDAEENKFWIAKFTGALLSVADANDFMVITFFPTYCVSRGMSATQVGACFSAHGICTMVFALIVPHVVNTVKGQKLGVLWGLRTYAASRIPYMLLIFMPDSALFPISLVLFVLTAASYAFVECCATAWTLSSVSSEDRTSAISTMSSGRILGSLLGPALGGVLFSIGGITVPFCVGFVGLTLILQFCTSTFSVGDPDVIASKDESKLRTDSVIRSPGVIVCELSLMAITGVLFGTLIWTQLSFRMDYHVPTWGYSLIVCCVMFMNGLSMAFLTPALENYLGPYKAILVGIVVLFSTYLIMGPSPWLAFLPTTQLWVPIVGFAFWGIACGVPFAIFASLAMNIAIASGWSENEAAVQIASLQVFVMGAGVGFGPIAFMSATDQFGLRSMTSCVFVGGLVILGGLLLVLALLDPPMPASEDPPTSASEPETKQAL